MPKSTNGWAWDRVLIVHFVCREAHLGGLNERNRHESLVIRVPTVNPGWASLPVSIP